MTKENSDFELWTSTVQGSVTRNVFPHAWSSRYNKENINIQFARKEVHDFIDLFY